MTDMISTNRTRRNPWHAAGIPFCIGILGLLGSSPARPSDRGGSARVEIRAVLDQLQEAIQAKNLDASMALYSDPKSAEAQRTRAKLQATAGLDILSCRIHEGDLKIAGGGAVAILLTEITYRENGREKADSTWSACALNRAGGTWKIVSDEDRDFIKARKTDLHIQLDPEKGILSGSVAIQAEVLLPGEDHIILGLNRGLDVRELRVDGRVTEPERTGDILSVPLRAPLKKGDAVSVGVAFHGSLFNESKENGYSQVSLAPEGCFASWVTSWYPHLSAGGSKSEGTLTYQVPKGYTVASSGRLMDRKPAGDGEEQVFTVTSPLDFSFAAARYFHREQTVNGTTISVYFLKGGDAKADLYETQCAKLLASEQNLYGRFPFDGYAVVEIPAEVCGSLGGSSEQGMNLFPVGMLPDDRFPLPLMAHEMGHSWWGNTVDSDDGPIFSEALAQVTAALCIREMEGEPALRRFLKYGWPDYPQSAQMYFNQFADKPGRDLPLGLMSADSAQGMVLHTLADTKGHFVYNMLRETIGDEAFLAGLRDIIAHHTRGKAGLRDLQAAWEKASGKKLDSFFQEWFQRPGAPEFVFKSTTAEEAGGVHLRGSVAQPKTPYTADVEIVLCYASGTEIKTLHVSSADTPFDFRLAAIPKAVLFDPDYKVFRWDEEFQNGALVEEVASLRSLGHTDVALSKLDGVLSRQPGAPDVLYHRGRCLQDAGRLSEAGSTYRSVSDGYSLYPAYSPWVSLSALHLGQVLDLLGKREDAVAWYEKVLRLPDASGSQKEAAELRVNPYQRPARPSPPGEEMLNRYAGNYTLDNGGTVEIRYEGGTLSFISTLPGLRLRTWLAWTGDPQFRLTAYDSVSLRFVSDEKGKVAEAVATLPGKEIHFLRKD
jgi:hypothetical protein